MGFFYLFNHQILAFKTVAKPTHAKYGIRRFPASLLMLLNCEYVSKIINHKRMISINANNGLRNPKNKYDHNAFNPN